MPVKLERFIRVMTGGLVVSDNLVDVRDGKVIKALGELKAEIDRAADENIGVLSLSLQYDTLVQNRADALKLKGNKAQCEALETVKTDARIAAKAAPAKVDTAIKDGKECLTMMTMADGICDVWRNLVKHGLPKKKGEGKKDNEEEDKGPDLSFLDQPSKDTPKLTQKVRKLMATDSEQAVDDWTSGFGEYQKALAKYRRDIVKPSLTKEIDELIKKNPDGPEAKMKKALGFRFEMRLLDVTVTAQSFGVNNDILSPGEQVAIFTYTSNDYKDMNGMLLGLITPDGEEKEELEIKCAQTAEALKKLPAYIGVTRRGERSWPGVDDQYVKDNVFTVKSFWSSGVGFKFSGKYQISIDGKSGKDVASISNYPNESEVLFSPGTKFKVIDRQDKSENEVQVTVREV